MAILPAIAAVVAVECSAAAPPTTPSLPARALVTADDVQVLSAPPAASSTVVGCLHRSEMVTVVNEKGAWYQVRHERAEGWVSAGRLSFLIPTPPPDPYEASGDMGWFYARFGTGTAFQVAKYTERSFSIAEYRKLIRAVERGDGSAPWVLGNSLFDVLQKRPDDSRYALLKSRVFSKEFIFLAIRNTSEYPWFLYRLPPDWWTAYRLVELTLTVSGVYTPSVVHQIIQDHPRLLAGIEGDRWGMVLRAAALPERAGAASLVREGLYPLLAAGNLPPSLEFLREGLLREDLVIKLHAYEFVPNQWWTADRLVAFLRSEVDSTMRDRVLAKVRPPVEWLPGHLLFESGAYEYLPDQWWSRERFFACVEWSWDWERLDRVVSRVRPGVEIMSPREYRAFLKMILAGEKCDHAIVLLAATIYRHLAQNPGDPRYAEIKTELYSSESIIRMLGNPASVRLAPYLPDDWITSDQALASAADSGIAPEMLLQVLPERLRHSREFALAFIRKAWRVPGSLVKSFGSDRQVVAAAMKRDPCALHYASEELQADPKLKEAGKDCSEY